MLLIVSGIDVKKIPKNVISTVTVVPTALPFSYSKLKKAYILVKEKKLF